jgi:hypothetical protein
MGVEEFMVLSPSNLRIVGLNGGIPLQMQDTMIFRTFPSLIDMTYADNFWVDGDPFYITLFFIPRGVGTLITPYGTHNDVVMMEEQLMSAAQVTFDHTYKWYSTSNLLVPLAHYSLFDQVLFVNEQTFTTEITEAAMPNLRVWPVPSSGEVSITSTRPVQQAELLDATGRVVATPVFASGVTCTIDLTPYGMGLYMLRTRTQDGWTTTRIVRE